MFLLKGQGKQFWFYTGYNEKMVKEFYIEAQHTPMFPKMSFLWQLNKVHRLQGTKVEGGKQRGGCGSCPDESGYGVA